MTNPFAQAFSELRAIVGREKEYDLKQWKRRWIDEAAVCVRMTGLEELQQPSEMARAELLASRTRAQALTFGELLLEHDGVLAKAEKASELGGGTEHRLFLCVVRAEPKE